MKLASVSFRAYRSLLDVNLDFSHACLGLVGINESGKTNVLRGLAVLSDENKLSRSDTPKMARRRDPEIRFSFELDDGEVKELGAKLEGLVGSSVDCSRVTYTVTYNRKIDEEQRYFELSKSKIPAATFFRKEDALTDRYTVIVDGQAVPLANLFFLNEAQLKENEDLLGSAETLVETSAQIEDIQASKESRTKKIETMRTEVTSLEAKPAGEQTEKESARLNTLRQGIESLTAEIDKLVQTEKALNERLEPIRDDVSLCKIPTELVEIEAELESQDNVVQSTKEKLATAENAATDEASKKEVSTIKKRLNSAIAKRDQLKRAQESLMLPLRDRFSNDAEKFQRCVAAVVEDDLRGVLPRVVSWQHDPDYILQGETEFAAILKGSSLDSISRPLLNVFRIGLGVKTFDDLRDAIREIQEDPSERSRLKDRLNVKLHNYLQSVWADYDQKVAISLERDRIRVEFYDPKCKDASYYRMQERSQGCQTFVSFLLTVGAEAKHGVIRNTLLLLDEPETHLHPSGVRYMLKELIFAASKGNHVVFATHSVFMIDQDEYDRHVIVKKDNERTQLLPSMRSRIGFFMQEEVLYAALDVDTSKLQPRRQHNFVFEGHGDATLFEAFYRQALKSPTRPFDLNKTSFYHGGKCGDIQKYFTRKPIQLGTDWVFILDTDKPANELRAFLEGKYKPYIGQCIHIFQYSRSDQEGDVELEDLIPAATIREVLEATATEIQSEVDLDHSAEEMLFGEYIALATKPSSDPNQLKALFKERLNNEIESIVKGLKDVSRFKEVVPAFLEFANEVISQLTKSSKRPVKKSDPEA